MFKLNFKSAIATGMFVLGSVYLYSQQTILNNPSTDLKTSIETGSSLYNNSTKIVDSDTRVLDGTKSIVVGAIDGKGGVTSTGGAKYSIPIYCPPGTNGAQPNISIGYNSQSGMGLLGLGWNLQGLSAITRVGKNYFCDANVTPVNIAQGDYFALDGNRLEVKTGTYGQNGAVYTTRAEDFYKITSIGSSGSGPQYFKVITKEGVIMKYGSTADSRVDAYDKSGTALGEILMWRLDTVTDQNGNYIVYNYYEYGQPNILKGESYIKSITYTGNIAQGITPYNTINFNWVSRIDENTEFIGGAKVPDRLILQSIRVLTEGGSLVKEYDFAYINNFQTCLSSITEKASDGSAYNSTLIKWGTTTPPAPDAITTLPDDFSNGGINWHNSFKTVTGDFNGDGISDVIIAFMDNTSGEAYLEMYLGTGTGGFIRQNSVNVVTPRFIDMIAVDYNNDGIDELLIEQEQPTIPETTNILKFYFSGYFLATDGGISFPEAPPLTMQYADFYGDGKNEIIFQDAYGIVKETMGGSVPKSAFGSIPVFTFQSNNNYNFDFNGNGKSDILSISGSNVMVYEYDKLTSQFVRICNDPMGNFNVNNIIFPGDYNGDGKTDLLFFNKQTFTWQICYSTGKTLTGAGFDWLHTSQVTGLATAVPNTAPYYYNYSVTDVNGDGKSDIIAVHQNTSASGCPTGHISATLNVYLSKGEKNNYSTSFETLSQQVCPEYQTAVFPTSGNQYFNPCVLFFGDFNGDGNTDILWRWSSNNFQTYFINQDGKNNLVTSIVDGLNNYNHFNYSTLAKGDCYTKGTNAVFPVNDIQAPIHVVKSMETPNNGTSTFITDYTYKNAKLHRQGLGFMGFEITTNTEEGSYSKLKTINTNNLQLLSGFFYVLPASTEVYNVNNQLIKKSVYTNSYYTYNNGTNNISVFPYINSTVNYDYLTNTKNSQSNTYDINGNLSNSQIQYYNATAVSAPVIEKITTTNTYYKIGTNAWLPNYLTNQSINKVRTGQSAETRYMKYSYDPNNCNLLTKITDPLMAKSVATTYTRNNNCGLVTSTLTSSSGLNYITNSFVYDSKYRFCTKTTNALSQFSTNTYEPAFGNVLSQTDVNGITITNTYDAFGRIKTTHTPEGNINYTTGWASGSIPPTTAVYFSNRTADNAPGVQTYYDVLGREVMTVTDGFSQKIYTQKQYDINGAVKSVSNPYFQGGTLNWTNYTYDNICDRVSSSKYLALTTTYAYSGETTTITNPEGQASSKTIDAAGRLVSALDNGGATIYTYASSGNTKTISSGGATITMGYDAYDRQNSLSDPNAGNSTYEYNAYGQLITQTDANGNVYKMTYDVLGRLKTKICTTDGTYTYNYDTEANGIGKVASVIHTNGTSQQFKYDALGRNYQFIETISGNNFTTNYSFDSYGNITKIVYPGGYSVNQTYDNFGNLKEITQASDNKSIWKLDAMDNLSHITQYETANKTITTNKNYDANYGLLSEIKTGNLFDYIYKFDASTGNLIVRIDNRRSLTEDFTYDNLNRLKTSTTGLTTNYFANGNIQNKSDVSASNYIYSSTHPNAVATINNSIGNISGLTQNITYNSFNKTSQITEDATTNKLLFTYGVDQQRKIMKTYENNNLTATKYYTAGFEREIAGPKTTDWNYITGGDGLAAIYRVVNGAGTLYWVAKDHLGSIMGLYNQSGVMVEEYSYDAWGRRRNPANWSYTIHQPTLITRGYTGHEHLDQFSLINMNGRLYDPVLGRMLSPDNFVQNATNTQGFNRYSYCNNNPLKYTDPSGQSAEGIARGVIDFFTFPARILADANDWINNKINGDDKPNGYYFNLNYISGGMHPAEYGNYNNIVGNTNPALLHDLRREWTNSIWQQQLDYFSYWCYLRQQPHEPNPIAPQQNNQNDQNNGNLICSTTFDYRLLCATGLGTPITVEEYITSLLKKQVGTIITSDEIVKVFPELSDVSYAIKDIERTKSGFDIHRTFLGRLAIPSDAKATVTQVPWFDNGEMVYHVEINFGDKEVWLNNDAYRYFYRKDSDIRPLWEGAHW